MATAPALDTSDAAFRASVVGASEVAALFGESPWLTHFELWHRKNGTIATPDFNAINASGLPEDMRIFCGVMLEKAVLEIAFKLWGYRPVDTPNRLDNGRGLGGHPDQIVICPQRGRGILEVKTADWMIAKDWGDEPPIHYQLQAQAYAGLAGVEWCDLITLVGGNDPRRFQMQFRPVIYADMEARVAEFWRSVRTGKPPKPDYARDVDNIAAANGLGDGGHVDLRHWNRGTELAATFMEAKLREKIAKADADAAKAEMLERMGDATSAMLEGFRVGAPVVKASLGTLITHEMIGTHVGGRKAHRRFDVKERNA
jgi:predicted phage-related endonuclease